MCLFAGKYYLVDLGYPMKKGFLAPYKEERYHIPEFESREMLHRPKERFNYLHSSLCSVIQRVFGVWKKKWKILKNMPLFHIRTQGHIIVVTMILHNFIRTHENNDVDHSRSIEGTSGRCERGYYDVVAHMISILDDFEMKKVHDNITTSIYMMRPL